MSIINKKILIFLMTLMFCQFQLLNLNAEDVKKIDEEELPAIDPFVGGVGSTNQVIGIDNQNESNNTLLNNLRLVGIVIGKYKKIAIFSAPDGVAFKYGENENITETTLLLDIFSDFVTIQDGENNTFEIYMNNIIKPIEG
tara:strand:- start:66 stop:488 length:423 start_codon:yes stop_codon:yes gene_type:complete